MLVGLTQLVPASTRTATEDTLAAAAGYDPRRKKRRKEQEEKGKEENCAAMHDS